MAKVVTDPKVSPQASLPDLSKPDPLVTVTLNDIAFACGSKWKPRYFTKVGNDYCPLPASWDVPNKVWRASMVQSNTDSWVPHYPADNMKRPTGRAACLCRTRLPGSTTTGQSALRWGSI